jgi:S-sulfosulfanyl-L-cysteine sulfohydrolase
MVDAQQAARRDVMTGHWEFTYGAERVKEIVEKDFKGRRHRLRRPEREDRRLRRPVFKPYVIREINGVPVAIVGQAFPYTPIANPRYMVADWSSASRTTCRSRRRGARPRARRSSSCCRTTAWTST